ncbi:TIGR02444 family protein [Alteromonas lipolytica]|uniref:TIGR02444 family protein n=1 Tax=Alteromonas lipolytica TaxID=1856405 RepID=A0A1E8FC51_9ALTE|nr:TIGR02444 family protein [Alteromonas lipolytica]OFI33083.1 TIGR02444 family protein [Alteromonas lipolytica]GGF62663.1 hypothetical protein GCM10011338_13890 [Alteromonas lipolytica]
MTSAPELTPALFWQHSLAVYAKPGVASACLTLQDDYQVNVNLLLFYQWCYCNQVRVRPSLNNALNTVISQTDAAIQAHREVRRKAKGTSNYEQLKQDELSLEAAQQAALVEAYHHRLPEPEGEREIEQLGIESLYHWLALPTTTETTTLINTVLKA